MEIDLTDDTASGTCESDKKRKLSVEEVEIVGVKVAKGEDDVTIVGEVIADGNANGGAQPTGKDVTKPASETANGTVDDKKAKIFETLEGFEIKKVLSNSADCKRVTIEGAVGDQTAIIILDKKPFSAEILPELLSSGSKLLHTFQNDIYGSYDCLPIDKGAEIKTTIVFPATQKHIDKYLHQQFYLINETPKIYAEVTLPYLEKSQFSIQWVFNILEHKKETDRIVFEDPHQETGFILLPDLKWDGKAVENLYLTAIVHTKGLKSLRDLTADHLPLLTNIWENGTKAIAEKYGLKQSQLRIFIHYQPSFYHLHVHFTSLQFNAPGIYTEKSHLLQAVISNIKGNPAYYQEATLPFVVKENDQLYTSLTNFGYEF